MGEVGDFLTDKPLYSTALSNGLISKITSTKNDFTFYIKNIQKENSHFICQFIYQGYLICDTR